MKKQTHAKTSGFTLVEIAVATAIIALVVAIAIPTINIALKKAQEASDNGTIRTLNDAANRARLAGLAGAGTYGTDEEAAIAWYKANRLIQNNPLSYKNIFFAGGIWQPFTLGEDLASLEFSHTTSPQENLASLLNDWGFTDPEQVPASWGFYVSGDIGAMLQAYGFNTFDELAQSWGYADGQSLLDSYGYASADDFARDYGYGIPGTADQMAQAWWGYPTFQEMADAWYSSTIPTEFTAAQMAEFAQRLPELTSSQLTQLLGSSALQTEDLIALNIALSNAIQNGLIPTWSTQDIQNSLYSMLQAGSNGQILDQLDLSQINLTNRSLYGMNLAGSNIPTSALNQASDLRYTNLSEMDLTGLLTSGMNFTGVNFSGATGITAAQVLQASTIQGANLSELDFAGASLVGKSLKGVIIDGAQNLTGPMLNGVTNVQGARLEGLDLSGWTTLPYTGDWQTATISLAGSIVNNSIMNSQVSRMANLEGVDLGFWHPNGIFGVNLSGVQNFTGANINGHIYWGTNMGTIDMTGYNYTGKVIAGDFRNVQNMTGTQLNSLSSMIHDNIFTTNLSGRDLTGWQPTYNIKGANLSNTKGISASTIATATNITNINLQGTGITKAALDAALLAAGKNPTTGNYNTSTITF